MKPIKLSLRGLNSYIEHQEIDFEKLTERGLFGIFGPTGSGKSTILDAITIAMYGEISRDTNEFINSLTDSASVSYEFEIGRGSLRRRFIIDRSIKRKKSGGLQTSLCRIVEVYSDGNKDVIADKTTEVNKKVADIVGLTSDDFTRSVVLPQGKFNDFLKLTGANRRDMLERIFGLEKYGRDLTRKIKERQNKQKEVLNELKGKLSQYDNVSEDLYKETESELNNLKLEEAKLREESKLLENDYLESKFIYETQIELSKYIAKKEVLDTKASEINNKKEKLENGKKAATINPYIESVNKLEKDISLYEYNIETIKNELNLIQQSITITDKHYKEAYNKKNNEVPVLLKNQERLENAIKLEETVEILERELQELREKYNLEITQKTKLENELKELVSKRDILIRKIKDVESNINEINVSADLKQRIYEGANVEKEYYNLVKDKKDKETKLENIKNELQNIKTNYERTSKLKKETDIKVEELVQKQAKLEKNCPGDSNLILSKNEELMNLRTKLQQAKENQAKKDELQKALNEILEVKYKFDREIPLLSLSLETKEKNIAELEKDLEELRYLNLASGLAKELKENNPCPVCGSTHHPNLTSSNKDMEIAHKQERLSILKEELSAIKNKLDNIKPQNAVYIAQEQSKIQELEIIKSKLEGIDIGQLSNQVNLLQNEVILLKNKIEEYDKSKKEVDTLLVKYREEKSKIDNEEARLHQNMDSTNKALSELKTDIENINKKYDEIKNSYNGYKHKLQIENISQKLEQININEKKIEELRITFDNLSKQRESYDENINNIQENIQKHNAESIMLKEVGSEKRRQKDQYQNELLAIAKGSSAKVLLEKVIYEINIINKNEENLKVKLENEKLQEIAKINERDKIEERLKASKEHLKSQSETLNKLLAENKFSDIYKVMQCLIDKEIMDNMEKEIKLYEEEYKVISLNIANLKDKLNGKNISEEKYRELEVKLKELKSSLNEKVDTLIRKEERLNNIRAALDKVKDISKIYEEVNKKMDLLNELDKVTQGNKFVEYVATNQLKYIAIEASKRLKNITKGRYALELDTSGNFIMRDDFNGGVRRSVDTLSGGETFLTSLSLALALSSQIQLKGSAPLEFFFLDEGFGTLDSDLLEIVMQSLERLHSDKLSVGIISHVEELKNRVPVKLIVTLSEGGYGSKVKIEYS